MTHFRKKSRRMKVLVALSACALLVAESTAAAKLFGRKKCVCVCKKPCLELCEQVVDPCETAPAEPAADVATEPEVSEEIVAELSDPAPVAQPEDEGPRYSPEDVLAAEPPAPATPPAEAEAPEAEPYQEPEEAVAESAVEPEPTPVPFVSEPPIEESEPEFTVSEPEPVDEPTDPELAEFDTLFADDPPEEPAVVEPADEVPSYTAEVPQEAVDPETAVTEEEGDEEDLADWLTKKPEPEPEPVAAEPGPEAELPETTETAAEAAAPEAAEPAGDPLQGLFETQEPAAETTEPEEAPQAEDPESPPAEAEEEAAEPTFLDLEEMFQQGPGTESSEVRPRDYRKWLDQTGRYSVEAEMLGATPSHLYLEGPEGRKWAIAYAALSDQDLAFVRDEVATLQAKKSRSQATPTLLPVSSGSSSR